MESETDDLASVEDETRRERRKTINFVDISRGSGKKRLKYVDPLMLLRKS